MRHLGPSVFCLVAALAGCAGSRLPPALSAGDQADIDSTHFALTVGVERDDEAIVYSDALLRALRATDLFERVEYVGDLDGEPDLIASVEEHIYGTAVVPLATGLTLGVIPTEVGETHGHVFLLRSPSTRADGVRVEYTYDSMTILGFAGGFKSATSADWTGGDPRRHERFYDRLALAIVANADAIDALAGKD